MSNIATVTDRRPSQFVGRRMMVDDFLEIPDDGYNYELVNGVVVLSPSPEPRHQAGAGEIFHQLYVYVRKNRLGKVLAEVDVYFGKTDEGKDLVYRPEVVFIRAERWAKVGKRIEGPPDQVV